MLLQIEHLTITHRKDLRVLAEDFSLVLNAGDRAVIVGEEGNGKSTLLRWIYDPQSVEDYADCEGRRSGRASMGYLPQELPAQLREQSAAEALRALSPGEWYRLAAELDLDPLLYEEERPLRSLSGGERVKLQTALLLARNSEVLLLDEPSNDLDLETLLWLERRIAAHRGAVLYISHDETLIERTANRVILLEQLRHKQRSRWTVANLPFAEFMAQRRGGFEKQAQLARSERRADLAAMERFRRIQQRVEHEQNVISRSDPSGGRLLKKKMASVKAMERRYEREREEMTELPEYEEAIALRFDGAAAIPAGRTVLDWQLPALCAPDGRVLARELRLHVRGPERIGIVGRNGAGKTTLLRLLLAALRARDGYKVGYLPQDYAEAIDPRRTPVEFLAPSGSRADETAARTRLGSLNFARQEMLHPMDALSGGQKAKLLLLRLCMGGVGVLVLDEPTRNLSPLSGPEIRALLVGFPGAIVSVSHDRKYLAQVCTRVLELTETGLRELRPGTGSF